MTCDVCKAPVADCACPAGRAIAALLYVDRRGFWHVRADEGTQRRRLGPYTTEALALAGLARAVRGHAIIGSGP